MPQTTRTFWGIFSSSNPLTDALLADNNEKLLKYINYADIQPQHVKQAATEFQSKYEADLKTLEESLQAHCSYEDLVPELERITRPLTVLTNIITLLSCVMEPNFSDALHEANDVIQFKHERSHVIKDALLQIVKQLDDDDDDDDERKKAIAFLLRKHRLNGLLLSENEETLQQIDTIHERLAATQAKFLKRSFLTMEQHGQVASPQELIPYMYEMIALQQHLSKLLGYASYAEYSLDKHDAMAKSVEEIQAVHDAFEQQGLVEEFSSDEVQSQYLNLLANDKDDGLKDYFELNSVLDGMFNLCQTMFGVVIQEQEKNVNGWHRDVRLFHLFDAAIGQEEHSHAEPIASFYLDLFRRQHKDVGCFMTPIQYKSDTSIPIVAISMDIRPPMWDDAPAELEKENVVNMFHEFGHALQHMLADVKLGAYSGAQLIEEDASETVSQFMEYWLFEGGILAMLAKHRETGDSISAEVMDKIKLQRKATKANELLHRLFLGHLELELSSAFDPHGDESIIALQRKSAVRYCPSHLPPKGNIDPLIQLFQSNAGGKCTMQYRYLWSEVMSADAFDAFVDDSGNVVNDDKKKETGEQFRKAFLNVGASKSTAGAFEMFRNRGADVKALLSRYEMK